MVIFKEEGSGRKGRMELDLSEHLLSSFDFVPMQIFTITIRRLKEILQGGREVDRYKFCPDLSHRVLL